MAAKRDRQNKPVLTPPRGEAPSRATNPLAIVLTLVSLLVLLVLSATVIWLLPAREPLKTGSSEQARTTFIKKEPLDQKQVEPAAEEAERSLETWLRVMAAAEADNIAAWAVKDYADIQNMAGSADRFYQNGDYKAARDAYDQSARTLENVLASKTNRLEEAIRHGQQALDSQQTEQALSAFQQALAIDPDNGQALQGLQRASNLDHVLTLYNDGLRLEQEGSLEQARQLFQEAKSIDRDFLPAATALSRVDRTIRDLRFEEAMSQAITALDNGQLPEAGRALAEAALLRPDDQAMIAARQRAAELGRARKLRELQMLAETLRVKEDWNGVVEVYRKALQVDDQVGFATIGLPEASKRLQLDTSLKSIIASPERLQDDGPLREAQNILAHARQVENPGKMLQAQIAALGRLVDKAMVTVDVILRSDNATEVEMYHVGRFSPFVEKRIALKPGTYTVVGRRAGFRDVRLSIKIEADMQLPVFYIRCEEPI